MGQTVQDDDGVLRALDAGLLYAKGATTLMHLGTLCYYQPGSWFDHRGRRRHGWRPDPFRVQTRSRAMRAPDCFPGAQSLTTE